MNDAATRFQQLVADEWEQRCRTQPIFATCAGEHGFDDLLPDFGEAAHHERLSTLRTLQARLRDIDALELEPAQRLDRAILARHLEKETGELGFQSWRRPISKTDGFHTAFPALALDHPFETLIDCENFVARLRAFPRAVAGLIESMREGIRQGQAPPRETLEGVEEQIAAHLPARPEESRLFQPFLSLAPALPESARVRLKEEARRAVEQAVLPAYRDLAAFFHDEALPAAATEPGASHLPEGRAFYEHRVRAYTSLDLSPEAVHQTGLEEVARIRAEMEDCVARAGFQGSLADFIVFLRGDPRFHAASADELLRHVAWILKRMDGQLPRLFGKLPRTPYGLVAMSDDVAPGNTSARYWPPRGNGRTAGFFHLNTWDLPSRPLYEMEALALHEAVPGHHLQLALQQELDLPHFRRFGDFTAYIEGWALYAERLGLEAGFYQDPHSDFGRLSFEMWRACRLVVDTGLHALGWPRERAVAYLAGHTALSPLNVSNEIDRYIAWPGQALAYKIGELAIRRLRRRAEEALGPRFDLRAFHDTVLETGALPLDLLEHHVEEWLPASLQFANLSHDTTSGRCCP